jgi:hypothetical protein
MSRAATQSLAAALLVFLPAAAGAGLVAADLRRRAVRFGNLRMPAGTLVPDTGRHAARIADAHREALDGPLLDALDRDIADPIGASKQDASVFSYALYLLANWTVSPGSSPRTITGRIVQDKCVMLIVK